jgi:hypothetical protein
MKAKMDKRRGYAENEVPLPLENRRERICVLVVGEPWPCREELGVGFGC